MDFSKVQPIINESALYIEKEKTVVIADLHIGIENELIKQGINTKSQTKKMTKRVIDICKKHKTKKIVLLGDIKHNIPTSTYWEKKDVKIFLETIEQYGEIHIYPGNHDGNIKRYITKNTIMHPSDGDIIKKIGYVHGHRWPNKKIMKSEIIIMAHTHPTIMLTDRRGYKMFEPCWIKTNFSNKKLKEKYPESVNPKLIILPAFNPLCGGMAINKDGIMGPIGKIINLNDSKVFLLDGLEIGKIKDIN